MMKNVFPVAVVLVAAIAGGFLLVPLVVGANVPAAQSRPANEPVVLPSDIVWETNMDDPPIGAPEAIRGGTFNNFIRSYPLTFRLMGPNSNDAFAAWNRAFTLYFPSWAVIRLPTTTSLSWRHTGRSRRTSGQFFSGSTRMAASAMARRSRPMTTCLPWR